MIPRSLALPAVLLMTGAFATPALAAKQTLRFTVVRTSSHGGVEKAKLVGANGKIIGHSVLTCKPPNVKHVLVCTTVFNLTAPKKGSISAKVNINLITNKGHGPITGGTGAYAGARGTNKGTGTSPQGATVNIVLTIIT